MKRIREPAVAGSFYPSDPNELRTVVEDFLDRAELRTEILPPALVVPHAGYIYSGAVAASAFAQLLPHREHIRRVILLGPAHRVPVKGLALSGAEAFRTPLGNVPLDPGADRALEHPAVTVDDDAHRLEHSLEVQLPFLQAVLDRFSIVPLVVGASDDESTAQVIDVFWNTPGTLVVVSTDLTHYLPYTEAAQRDERTCRAIEALDPGAIDHSDACGAGPLRGLLATASRRGLSAHTLDLRNSGDTAGPRHQVVGYGAWMFLEEKSCRHAA